MDTLNVDCSHNVLARLSPQYILRQPMSTSVCVLYVISAILAQVKPRVTRQQN